jgi:hypothetical protein
MCKNFNAVFHFYHKEACLLRMDTLKLSFGEAAEILKALLPGFEKGIFSPQPWKVFRWMRRRAPIEPSLRGAPGRSSSFALGRGDPSEAEKQLPAMLTQALRAIRT